MRKGITNLSQENGILLIINHIETTENDRKVIRNKVIYSR